MFIFSFTSTFIPSGGRKEKEPSSKVEWVTLRPFFICRYSHKRGRTTTTITMTTTVEAVTTTTTTIKATTTTTMKAETTTTTTIKVITTTVTAVVTTATTITAQAFRLKAFQPDCPNSLRVNVGFESFLPKVVARMNYRCCNVMGSNPDARGRQIV